MGSERVEENIILGEFLANFEDLQEVHQFSSQNLEELAKQLVLSAKRFEVPVYVLTNSFSNQTIDNLNIRKVTLFKYPDLGLYFYRLIIAYEFLLAHPEIKRVVLNDVPDVRMLNYPFDAMHEGKLYMGDEPFNTDSGFVTVDSKPEYMEDFFAEHIGLQTLNPGVIGGSRAIVLEFLGIATTLISQAQLDRVNQIPNSQFGNFEMGLINYIAYRYFANRLVHGREVSTIFGFNQTKSSAWFKHK